MTWLLLFCVRDQKAECFPFAPFAVKARGEAIRSFIDLVNDGQSQVAKHPEDYELFEVGRWNQSTGVVEPLANGIVALGNGLSYVREGRPSLVKEA